ncbi:DUF975 family protein [Clostridium sp.]|uniref:DUF975 family protein n=1 Tax=Clostridium sp. TaxID=1506 RepID=UPI003D6CB23E
MEVETQLNGQPDYRKQAREQLKDNRGKTILFTLSYGIIEAILYAIIHFIFKVNMDNTFNIILVLTSPLALSSAIFYVKFSKSEKVRLMDILTGFNRLLAALIIYIVLNIPSIIQQLISFVAPNTGANSGVIISIVVVTVSIFIELIYTMSYYIIADEKNIGIKEALIRSRKIMYGHKMEFFLLQLSFIGWGFVALLTVGIGLLWIVPYMELTYANFFLDIKQNYSEQTLI